MDNPAFSINEESEDEIKIKRYSSNSNSSIEKHYKQNGQSNEDLVKSEKNPNNNNKNSSSLTTKWNLFLKTLSHISIEPIIILHLMSLLMTALVFNDFVLDRACRVDLNYNSTVCDAIAARNVTGFYVEQEAEAQQIVASMGIWRFAIEYSVPIFLVLLLGSWSDVYGRKFPLILPMIGSVIKNIGLILCFYFRNWNVMTLMLFTLVPTTLSGSYPIFSMAFHTVIVDTTTKQYRTIRFGIAYACQTVGQSVGTVLAGHLFSKTRLGFVGLFGIAGGIEALTIIVTMILIKNTKGSSSSYDGEEIDPPSTKDAVKGMLNLRHLYEALKTTLKSRPNYGRLKLWILMFSLFCASAPFYGESSVIYLFLRIKFSWGASEYGFFGMYQAIAGGVGVLLSMGVLSWWFGLKDCLVGFLGCLSQISSCFVYAFATTTSIYLAPLIDILNGAMPVAARSMITKSIDINEQGKILSFLAGLDSINPVLSSIAYNGLYKVTLSFLPGAFFLLSAALAVPPFLVFSFFTIKSVCFRNKEISQGI